jgi:23S rRNA (guanine745-N1)-methyltransferase
VLPAVIAQLRCPNCHERLAEAGRALQCPRGHSFDIARQGYVDLTAGRVTHQGDSPDMVAARETLLTAGRLSLISDAVGQAAVLAVLPPYQGKMVVEVGAGTGHYLAGVLDRLEGAAGLAVDVSKAALRRAARAHPRMAAVRADVWRGLPIADGSVDLVLDVFAPRSGAEFARILAPGGAVLVVTAEPAHLHELVEAAGLIGVDPEKEERLAATLGPWLTQESAWSVQAPLQMPRKDAAALISMGPSARHLAPGAIERILRQRPEPITATISVRLTVWRV